MNYPMGYSEPADPADFCPNCVMPLVSATLNGKDIMACPECDSKYGLGDLKFNTDDDKNH